ncbi:ficolin-2-like [Anopheles ziemanni]|uniref:ficolin-2-like n=1 Tax=Anopheles coustani TaxID=139045 RepID=UPI00265A0A68|nr:ficolin-2-like [Anopheles coustani]XP_058176767.1 ficolin-2-like [Anopheles ziemanni]
MSQLRWSLLVVAVFCVGIASIKCETNGSGFSFEMIMTKLQVLEFHIMQKDLQVDERITVLSSNVANLVKSVEQLSWVAQQTGETVNQVGFNGKQVAHNLSLIQRDLRDVIAEQRLLLSTQQFGEYLIQGGCKTSNMSQFKRESRYTSCRDVPFHLSGIYQIQPEKPFKEPMSVLCDQEYESGGWTVIQHRFDGSVNFYRGWQEYKSGFGSLEGEFWLGLDRIHQLTASKPHELVVLLEDYDGNKTYAKYDRFEIGDEGQKYVLKSVGTYSGTAGDSITELVGMKFTTLDADNDTWDKNCAVEFTGAWWYTACHKSNLNGKYLRGETKEFATGMVWQTFRGYHHALKTSKIMVRPLSL